jgi:hypothetical protein
MSMNVGGMMTVVSGDLDMQTTRAPNFGSGMAGSVTASCVSGGSRRSSPFAALF